MAGVLNFSQYLGGPDNVQCEQIFPSTQRKLQYNFGVDITGWSFFLKQQVIVVDTVTFDRTTGQPNFSGSTVIGYFAETSINTGTFTTVVNASQGKINITVPGGLYTGPILPDARKNVPIMIYTVGWQDVGVPVPQVDSHRWAFILCYEAGVTPTDPTADSGYTAI